MSKKKTPFEEEVIIYFKARAGKQVGGSTLAQKVGPLGVNAKKLGEDIAKKIADYPGIKVHTRIAVQNRQAKIEIVPSTSHLLKDILRKKGSLGLEDIKKVANEMGDKIEAKNFEGRVRQVMGTCVSLHALIEGMNAKDYIKKVKSGEISI